MTQAKSCSTSTSDWRAYMLRHVRSLIEQADPHAVEEVKWRKPSNPAGVPVWSHAGPICTGETYKDKVKLTFAKGGGIERSLGSVQRQPRWQGAARHRSAAG